MKWIDVSNGCGGHNGEYDWKCSNCGNEDWQAHGVNPNKDGTQCRRCGSRPEAEKETVKGMTREEVQESLTKYHDYLVANGIRVLSAGVYVEVEGKAVVVYGGNEEMLREMHCITEAGLLGYDLKVRP